MLRTDPARSPSRVRRAAALLLLAAPLLLAAAPAQAPSGLQRSGRWFTYDGRPRYQVGWDSQQLACDPSVNYVQKLDLFAQYRINTVRIWAYCYWDGPNYLHPWTYSGGTAGKFDLDQWNAAYWSRIRDFVSQARARDITVEFSLFPAYPRDPNWWTNDRMRVAWNRAYNVNGAFSTNASGHFYPQYFDLNHPERSTSGKTLRDYHQALADKSLSELGGFPNVYFEICNEFPGVFGGDGTAIAQAAPWQQYWCDYLKQRTSRLVTAHSHEGSGQHTLGVQYFQDRASVDVLNFHFYTRDPQRISDLCHSLQTRGKAIANNEGFDNQWENLSIADFANGSSRFAWGLFTAGGHYSVYQDDSNAIGDAMWTECARRQKALRDIVETVRFWELSPVDAAGNELDGLVTQGPSGGNRQVIGKAGSEYVAYFWGSKSSTAVSLPLPAGSYSYAWHDVRNAALIGNGSVTGGGATSIPAPATAAWDAAAGAALVIKYTGTVPAPLPPPPPPPPPAPPPPPPTSAPSVTQLNLMDADTDQPVAGHAPLSAGATIDLASLPSRNLTVVAVTSPSTVGSVRFAFDGNANYRVENAAPYALQGDNAGDLAPAPLGVGQHSVTATAYSASGATGTAGAPLTRVFTLIDSAPAPSPGPAPGPAPSPAPAPSPTPPPPAPSPAATGPGPDGIQWLRDLCGAGTAGSPSWAWALAGALLACTVARGRRPAQPDPIRRRGERFLWTGRPPASTLLRCRPDRPAARRSGSRCSPSPTGAEGAERPRSGAPPPRERPSPRPPSP